MCIMTVLYAADVTSLCESIMLEDTLFHSATIGVWSVIMTVFYIVAVTSLCGSMMLEGTSWHSAAMGVYRIDEQTCFTQPMYRLEWPDSGKQRYMYLLPGLYFGEDRESARDSWVVSNNNN